MSDGLVQIDRSQSGVAVVTLSRPEKRNALNIELIRALVNAVQELEHDSECRVLILTGEGPVFCAGLDLVEANQPELAETSAEGIRQVFSIFERTPLIIIGAIHGAAYAGGAGLVAACDLVVAADNLKVALPEVRRGLIAAMVSAVLLRKLRGGDIRELLLLGEPIDAARALQMGLVQCLVPADQVLEAAYAMARTVLAGGPQAVQETKHLLNQNHDSLTLDTLKALHERIRTSDEAREGFAAFIERREPNWHKAP